MNEDDLTPLRRGVARAAAAVDAGDEPFGSVLVSGDGQVLAEDHNRERSTKDVTAHPELALARWASVHLSPAERAAATVFTSGEHCPMCAAAHGWAGLGRIVYASSAPQTASWYAELGVGPSPVAPLRVTDVLPGAAVAGPVQELADQVYELHRKFRSGH